MDNYERIANDTLKLLKKNTEWIKRYDDYVKDITENSSRNKNAASKFHMWKPFAVYISTTNAKSNGNTVHFSIRYKGQHVAEMKVSNDRAMIRTEKSVDETNKRDFGCEITIPSYEDWNTGENAIAFRKYFKDELPKKNKNIEHLIESKILYEMSERTPKIHFANMRPIKINNIRYSLPTPIKGSGVGVEYSGIYGGGIDIFTRNKRGNQSRLNIMELKDEYTNSEPPEKVVCQAIKYAVFIQQLLRSKSGKSWWKVFGMNEKRFPNTDEPLILNATCIMPNNQKGENDTSFQSKKIIIEKNDVIELHYIYFDFNGNEISRIQTSL